MIVVNFVILIVIINLAVCLFYEYMYEYTRMVYLLRFVKKNFLYMYIFEPDKKKFFIKNERGSILS